MATLCANQIETPAFGIKDAGLLISFHQESLSFLMETD